MAVGVGGCATPTHATVPAEDPASVNFSDFWNGKPTLAGLPVDPTLIATLDERLAAFPKEAQSSNRPGPEGGRRVRLRLTPAAGLRWIFVGPRLVAVGWDGGLYAEYKERRLIPGVELHPDTEDFGLLRRIVSADESGRQPSPVPLIEGLSFDDGAPTGTQRTLYRVFDEPAFLALAEASAARQKAKGDLVVAAQQKRAAELKAAADAAARAAPLNVLSDAARRLEAHAPLTAAGLWARVFTESWDLRVKAIDAQPRGDTRDADRWRRDAHLGLQRTLVAACARALPALDEVGVPRPLLFAYDPQRTALLAAALPASIYCFGGGVFDLAPWLRAVGRAPLRVALEPRTITGLSEQVVHADKTYVNEVEETQQNPEREKAMGPVRELARQIRDLEAVEAEWHAEAARQASDRSNQVFEGTGARRDASGHGNGPAISSFTRKQGGAALILEGMSNEGAAATRRQADQLMGRLRAMVDQLPPETITRKRTETRVERHTRLDWKSQLKQRVTVGTSPPLVVDVDTPAFLNVEEGRQLTAQRANELLMGSLGDELVAPFVQRAFAQWLVKRATPEALSALPLPPGLSGAAASTEKQWRDHFFAGAPKPTATAEMADWLPPSPIDAPRPTDPNLVAAWDQPEEGDFIDFGGGIVGSNKRLVYPKAVTDFVFELDAEFLGGSPEATLGLCWRGSGANPWAPSDSYTVGLQWSGTYNVFAIAKDTPRAIATGGNGSFQYRPTPLIGPRKNHIRLEAKGTHSEIQVNGKVLDQLDDATIGYGRLCIDTLGARVKLTHLSIRPL